MTQIIFIIQANPGDWNIFLMNSNMSNLHEIFVLYLGITLKTLLEGISEVVNTLFTYTSRKVK